MRAAVITYPGSNCDRDLIRGFELAGFEAVKVWHKETGLPDGVDVVGVPGGFSYGDYLRCGAIAAQSAISSAIRAHAARGGYVLGICNGFQVLTEMGLLPGALMRNANLRFICKTVDLRVETADSPFTNAYAKGDVVAIPFTVDPAVVCDSTAGAGGLIFEVAGPMTVDAMTCGAIFELGAARPWYGDPNGPLAVFAPDAFDLDEVLTALDPFA